MSNLSLLEQIEHCREEMIMLSHSYEMTDEIVIKASKKLDELLNQYEQDCQSKEALYIK